MFGIAAVSYVLAAIHDHDIRTGSAKIETRQYASVKRAQ